MSEFVWEKGEKGACLVKYLGEASRVEVPALQEGLAVTEIGPYAFHGHREVEEVTLPETVEKLGAHCFYDCRNLRRLCCADGIAESGDGCFKNCMALSSVEVKLLRHRFGFLKNLLEECSQKVSVDLTEQGALAARLLFPRFLQDYEENTAARIINQVTYGAGVHYRSCVGENGIDFVSYDGRFSLLTHLEEEAVCGETALGRLAAPAHLSEGAREMYLTFLHENLRELADAFVREERYDLTEALAELATESEREVILRAAQEAGALAMVSVLLQRHAARQEEDEFDL